MTANVLADAAWLNLDALAVHRQIGILTLIVLVALVGFSGVMLFVSRTTRALPMRAIRAVLVLAVAGVGASMWAVDLGGALRHTKVGR